MPRILFQDLLAGGFVQLVQNVGEPVYLLARRLSLSSAMVNFRPLPLGREM